MKDPTARQEVNYMRITTSMLNETAKRTGIPINQNNLLSYINNESSGGSTLLDALDKKKDKVSPQAAANYKKMEKSAQSLMEQAEKLAQTGETSFLEKIKESGNTKEAYAAVETYADRYNTVLSGLKKSTNMLDRYYCEVLQDAAAQNSEQLEKIGITIDRDGVMSVNKEKLNAASVEDIQNAFGGSGELASKTSFLADRIGKNAQAGMESVSSQYDGSGNLYSQLASRYDFWG